VAMDVDKIPEVLDWPMHKSVCALHNFHKLVAYYCKFVQDYCFVTALLMALVDIRYAHEGI
jgi:hypothetical protein